MKIPNSDKTKLSCSYKLAWSKYSAGKFHAFKTWNYPVEYSIAILICIIILRSVKMMTKNFAS